MERRAGHQAPIAGSRPEGDTVSRPPPRQASCLSRPDESYKRGPCEAWWRGRHAREGWCSARRLHPRCGKASTARPALAPSTAFGGPPLPRCAGEEPRSSSVDRPLSSAARRRRRGPADAASCDGDAPDQGRRSRGLPLFVDCPLASPAMMKAARRRRRGFVRWRRAGSGPAAAAESRRYPVCRLSTVMIGLDAPAAQASAASSTRATWTASRPTPSWIWWRQLVPSATTRSSGEAFRSAGKSDSSAMAKETSMVFGS